MLTPEIGGVVRTVLAAIAGFVAARGWIDQETAVQIAGAAATILIAAWSIWAKRKTT